MLCFFICLFFYLVLLYNDYDGGSMKKKYVFLIVMFIIVILGVVLLFFMRKNNTYEEISYAELNEMLKNKDDFVLFIGSNTCSACTVYRGTLNDVIGEYGVDVKYIDLSKLSKTESSKLTSKFPITGTPTTIFITDGDEEDSHNRIVGSAVKSKIIEKFKENGYIKE